MHDAMPFFALAAGVVLVVVHPTICYDVGRRDLDRIGREFCSRNG